MPSYLPERLSSASNTNPNAVNSDAFNSVEIRASVVNLSFPNTSISTTLCLRDISQTIPFFSTNSGITRKSSFPSTISFFRIVSTCHYLTYLYTSFRSNDNFFVSKRNCFFFISFNPLNCNSLFSCIILTNNTR